MSSPGDSPMEEVVFEIETSRVPKPIPVALGDLCRQTKFTRQEIRVMYRGFKTVRNLIQSKEYDFLDYNKNYTCNLIHSNSINVFGGNYKHSKE